MSLNDIEQPIEYDVIFTEIAQAHLDSGYLNRLQISPDYADRWMNELITAIGQLNLFPHLHPIEESPTFPGIPLRRMFFSIRRDVVAVKYRIVEPTNMESGVVWIASIRSAYSE
jgi:hypothetical protein